MPKIDPKLKQYSINNNFIVVCEDIDNNIKARTN